MWTKFSGILGLVLLLFGVGGGLMVNSYSQPLILLHLILGVGLLLVWGLIGGTQALGAAGEVALGRGARFSVNAVLYVAVFAGLLGVINWFIKGHDKRWDFTEEGIYSLSPQSRQVVENLKKPLKLVAFKGNRFANEEDMQRLFDLYSYHNKDKVKGELVDPMSKPHLVDQYEMKQGNVIYLEYGEGDKKGVSRINEATEEAITNAILKLARGEAKKVYVVEGHEEPGISDGSPKGFKEFANALVDEHFTVENLFLADKEKIPEDAAAVMLVAPKRMLLETEQKMLVRYAEDGGRLFLLSDPRTGETVTQIADHFGIQIGKNLVVDLVQRLFAAPALGAKVIAREYGNHPVTKAMTAQEVTIFDMASSVKPKAGVTGDKDKKGETYTELIKTSSSSWAETNLALLFDANEPTAAKDSEDTQGPVSLAVAYEKVLDFDANKGEDSGEPENKAASFKRTARVIVFGDSDWARNEGVGYYANRDLVVNCVNWLVGEEGGITLRPKSMKASFAPIARDTFYLILASSFLVPELLLVLGLLVWWKRKTVEV